MDWQKFSATLAGVSYLIDDNAIKDILIGEGRVTDLENPLPDKKDGFRLHAMWTTGDRAYIATRYLGYPNQKDNGYRMLILDLQLHSLDRVAGVFKVWTHDHSTGPNYFSKVVEKKKPSVN